MRWWHWWFGALAILVAFGPSDARAESEESKKTLKTVDLAVGGKHACAVAASGRVYCWGRNTDGQLGDGTRTDRQRPARVPGIADARSVVAGSAHTCVLHEDRHVSCWGFGFGGPDPSAVAGISTFSELTSTRVGDALPTRTLRTWCNEDDRLEEVVELSAGAGQTCALHESGGVLCWGESSFFSYGVDEYASSMSTNESRKTECPVPVWGLRDVETLASGVTSNCAIHEDGAATCWGDDQYNVARATGRPNSNGSRQWIERASDTMIRFPRVDGGDQVVVGGWQACLFESGGPLRCLGYNNDNSIRKSGPAKLVKPERLRWAGEVRAAATAGHQICAISDAGKHSGRVRCAGFDDGPMRPDDTGDTLAYRVPGATEAVEVRLGGYVNASDRHKTFDERQPDRRNFSFSKGGELSVAWTSGTTAGLYDFQLSGGFGCVRDQSGGVFCWGANDFGQLGDGTTTSRSTASRVRFGRAESSEETRPRVVRDSEAEEDAGDGQRSCPETKEFGDSDAPNHIRFRFGSYRRVLQLPELSATVTPREDLRIEVPKVWFGDLRDGRWSLTRWSDYDFVIHRPRENPRSFDAYDELPVEVGVRAQVPNEETCMPVPFRRRGKANIEGWTAPKPRSSGNVEGRVVIGAGPSEFGELTIEFDVQNVRVARADRFVPPSGRSVVRREGRLQEATGVRVGVGATGRWSLQVGFQSSGDEEPEHFSFQDIPRRSGIYERGDEVLELDTLDESGAIGTIYRLPDDGETASLFSGPQQFGTVPENAEKVARFETDTVVEHPEPTALSASDDGGRSFESHPFELEATAFDDRLVGFHRSSRRDVPLTRERKRFHFTPLESENPERLLVEFFVAETEAVALGQRIRQRPDRFVISASDGAPVRMEKTVGCGYELDRKKYRELFDESKLKKVRRREKQSGQSVDTLYYEAETKIRAERTDQGLVLKGSNEVQGEHRAVYATGPDFVFEGQLPLALRALPLEAGYSTTFRRIGLEWDTADTQVPAPGLDGGPKVRPCRASLNVERFRARVLGKRTVDVGMRKEPAYAVWTVKRFSRVVKGRIFWIGEESNRILKMNRVERAGSWKRVVEQE